MTGNIFGPDLGIVILVIVVVLLGGSQLPKIARNIGIAGKEFRKAQQEAEDEERDRQAAAAATPPAPTPLPPVQPTAAIPTTPPAQQTSPAPPSSATSDESSITLSRSELDALLKAREEQVRGEPGGSS